MREIELILPSGWADIDLRASLPPQLHQLLLPLQLHLLHQQHLWLQRHLLHLQLQSLRQLQPLLLSRLFQ